MDISFLMFINTTKSCCYSCQNCWPNYSLLVLLQTFIKGNTLPYTSLNYCTLHLDWHKWLDLQILCFRSAVWLRMMCEKAIDLHVRTAIYLHQVLNRQIKECTVFFWRKYMIKWQKHDEITNTYEYICGNWYYLPG